MWLGGVLGVLLGMLGWKTLHGMRREDAAVWFERMHTEAAPHVRRLRKQVLPPTRAA